MHARACCTHQLENRIQRYRLGDLRHIGQTQSGCVFTARGHAMTRERRVLRTQQMARSKVDAYCSARHNTCVSASGASAFEKPTQPASASSDRLASVWPFN